MINVIILGPPGAGKGTQSQRLEERAGLKQLSTGDMLRAEVAAQTEIGNKVKAILDRGDLVPDDLIVAMIGKRIGEFDCKYGVIFDGFPRTLAQAQALDAMLEKKGSPLKAVIELAVDEQELLNRQRSRIAETKAAGGEVRSDDNEETLRNRLSVFRQQTTPLIPYYRDRGVLETVDGMQPVDVVSRAIKAILAKNDGTCPASNGNAVKNACPTR